MRHDDRCDVVIFPLRISEPLAGAWPSILGYHILVPKGIGTGEEIAYRCGVPTATGGADVAAA
jgi:hypothetical protein